MNTEEKERLEKEERVAILIVLGIILLASAFVCALITCNDEVAQRIFGFTLLIIFSLCIADHVRHFFSPKAGEEGAEAEYEKF